MGETNDIRAFQLHTLEILKAVIAVCEANGLTYWADGGTCLGAVRHHGFIPWDDDVDIGMPRKDFDKFRAIAETALPEHLRLMDFERTRHDSNMFLKVHDVRTTMVEKEWVAYADRYTGVYVDIFPYDGCPEGAEWERLQKRLERMFYLNRLLRYNLPGPPLVRLKKAVVRLMGLVLPYNWATMRLERLMRRYELDACPAALESFHWRYPAGCLRQTVALPFEDITLPCPADYDTFLRTLYGDYMQLPPEAERESGHHIAYHSLEKSYLTHWWDTP